jgi:hypothetical protein
MYDMKVEIDLWGEAINYANYILNRVINSSLTDSKTPFEVWTKRKPNTKSWKVFGCVAYVFIPKQKRHKLDSISEKGIFVGYDIESKGYRVWLPGENKIVVRRDVKFMENQTWNHNINLIELLSNLNIEENNIAEEDSYIEKSAEQKIDGKELMKREIINEEQQTKDENLRRSERINIGVPPKDWNMPAARYWEKTAIVQDEIDSIALVNTSTDVLDLETDINENPKEWELADKEEYQQLLDNGTFELVDLPEGRKAIGCKIIRKIKYNADNSIDKRKSRIVAQGFNQRRGIDYNETFSPTLHHTSLRIILAISTKLNLELKQLDIKGAYLYADLEEEIYMKQPEGFEVGEKVCKLKKSLYGLKQAGRRWNENLNEFLVSNGFQRLQTDLCVYYQQTNEGLVIIGVYVDDQVIAYDNEEMFKSFIMKLGEKYQYTIKELNYILGIEIIREKEKGTIELSQRKYVLDMLKKFKMDNCEGKETPMECGLNLVPGNDENHESELLYQELIGSLIYAATCTRPDIAYSVNYLSRFIKNYNRTHWQAAKRVLRYLKNYPDVRIKYDGNMKLELSGWADADWASDKTDRKSVSGNVFFLLGGVVSWKSSKQKSVALSSMEAEFIALALAMSEGIWMRQLLKELPIQTNELVTIYQDNQGCIAYAKGSSNLGRAKHIDIKLKYVQEKIKDGSFQLSYTGSDNQIADILTKPLGRKKFVELREKLNLKIACCENENQGECKDMIRRLNNVSKDNDRG